MNGRCKLLRAAREMAVVEELGSESGAGVVGKAGFEGGWESRKDGRVELVTKALERKRI